jgi:hypothetical protein
LKPSDVTIVVAADAQYIQKLYWTYQTWVKFKPEITEMSMVVILDGSGPNNVYQGKASEDVNRFQSLVENVGRHPAVLYCPWKPAGGLYDTQREKMLTSLVMVPGNPLHVHTPWYLKIDADTVANAPGPWYADDWFECSHSLPPAFVTSPWGYTKPAAFLDRLEAWGDTVEGLAGKPRLDLPYEKDAKRAYHSRIISWLFFGNTAWTRKVASWMPDQKLPVPSQDTTLWYVAARAGDCYETTQMKRYGWRHMGRKSSAEIADTCKKLLNG